MKTIIALLLAGLLPTLANADLHTEALDYKQNGNLLEGFLAYEEGVKGKVPGVLLVPDWYGVKDHYQKVAERLAKLGYVAFVADIYGKGIRPANNKEAAAESKKYRSDRTLMRKRVSAALDVLKQNKHVDSDRIAAIGYCFGGTVVLELVRSGAPIAGVVSFHGMLDTPTPHDAKNIKAKVLVLHGADDPYVPPEQVSAFIEEMRNGGIDWQMVFYGDAVHSFSKPAAGTDKSKGAAYNESAAKRSWEAMKTFFKEIF